MYKQLQVNSEENVLRRVEMLEAEQKRVTAQLEAVTHKLAELDQGQIKVLQHMVAGQRNDIEFSQELLKAIKAIVDTDFIKGSSESAN